MTTRLGLRGSLSSWREGISYVLGGAKQRLIVASCLAAVLLFAVALRAQDDVGGPSAAPPPAAGENFAEPDDSPAPASDAPQAINLLGLLFRGGYLMLPIVCLSVLVVTVSIERGIALRRQRVLPDLLVQRIGQLGGPQAGFDPRQAYRICQEFPSTAAAVIRVMLLKVGRPHGEVERAVTEASEREADRLYANVRWLNLSAAVAPLLGLLGTVWGMIQAFHGFTFLAADQNKADYLAEGIFVALVTTLAGLSVAIPSAVLSHYFESRIQTLFHQINELLFNLLPQVERFEGRVRFAQPRSSDSDAAEGSADNAAEPSRVSPTPS